jgi:putative membrane protein
MRAMKKVCVSSGLCVLLLVWVVLPLAGETGSFTAHMLRHMAVVAVAAPLLALGLTDRTGLSERNLAYPGVLSLPLVASLVELIVVWGWHAPALRTWADTSTAAAVVEQASFLAAGLFLWIACCGHVGRNLPDAMARHAAGAFGLLLTSVHMTLLGALLSLSTRPLYTGGGVTCFGITLDAGEDQQLGGVVMLLIGAAVYLAGGVFLLAKLLSDTEPAGSRATR